MLKIKKNRGFTLIELLVVIAIIGILASIVLVSLSGARVKARDARRESDIRQISLAQEMFYNDNEEYYAAGSMPSAIGTYLDPVPKDPGAGSPDYDWANNTSSGLSCGTEDLADGQFYCTWATLEGVTKWFAASQKGTSLRDSEPTTSDSVCCW